MRLACLLLSVIASLGGEAPAQELPPAGKLAEDGRVREDLERVRELGAVTVRGSRPSSLPTRIPATIEGVTAAELARGINAVDAEDALKYLPSLLVRKRYAGDYDHAVLASRASGTGNSARSLVYVDGILLSNLLGNGATFTPRWGMVPVEQVERVDVLYGPFSAAYPGNSVGAVVDYVTRMPDAFEASAKVATFVQHASVYGSSGAYTGWQAAASVGDRVDRLAWWLDFNRLDSRGQPLAFATRLVGQGVPGGEGVPVTGAVAGRNPRNQDWLVLGDSSRIRTRQDHAKVKLAFDATPALRLGYTLGWWHNDALRHADTYLRNAAGDPVYEGAINVDGRRYTLAAPDFTPSTGALTHMIHGLSVKSDTRGAWDFELAASLYQYVADRTRSPLLSLPAAAAGGAGRITDQHGTGWSTLALRGAWRPRRWSGAHSFDFGVQREDFHLRTRVAATDQWIGGAPDAPLSAFRGDTSLTSLHAQDSWTPARGWHATLGLRAEFWGARDGAVSDATRTLRFAPRDGAWLSPKAALAWQATPAWELKAALGRAVRMPTVAELYQGTIASNAIVNNDPDLKPERSWTGELTAQRQLAHGSLRGTMFAEDMRDALYAQTNVAVVPSVTNIQNIDRIRTLGAELAWQAGGVLLPGLDLSASLTWAHSRIVANRNFPASQGRWQPRVPEWRANAVATYSFGEGWSATIAGRYGGRQYNTLDNSDPNGDAYTGTSAFLVADARLRREFGRHWSAALGVDNLNNQRYWAFHPHAQRTFSAELAARF